MAGPRGRERTWALGSRGEVGPWLPGCLLVAAYRGCLPCVNDWGEAPKAAFPRGPHPSPTPTRRPPRQLGVDTVHAETLPKTKAQKVRAGWRAGGKRARGPCDRGAGVDGPGRGREAGVENSDDGTVAGKPATEPAHRPRRTGGERSGVWGLNAYRAVSAPSLAREGDRPWPSSNLESCSLHLHLHLRPPNRLPPLPPSPLPQPLTRLSSALRSPPLFSRTPVRHSQ